MTSNLKSFNVVQNGNNGIENPLAVSITPQMPQNGWPFSTADIINFSLNHVSRISKLANLAVAQVAECDPITKSVAGMLIFGATMIGGGILVGTNELQQPLSVSVIPDPQPLVVKPIVVSPVVVSPPLVTLQSQPQVVHPGPLTDIPSVVATPPMPSELLPRVGPLTNVPSVVATPPTPSGPLRRVEPPTTSFTDFYPKETRPGCPRYRRYSQATASNKKIRKMQTHPTGTGSALDPIVIED